MHFLLFSNENFQNFLKCFPNNCVFRPGVRKINTEFVNRFWKNRLNLFIYCNFLKKFLKTFEKSPTSGGWLRPRTPYSSDPIKYCPPRTEILAAPLYYIKSPNDEWKNTWPINSREELKIETIG